MAFWRKNNNDEWSNLCSWGQLTTLSWELTCEILVRKTESRQIFPELLSQNHSYKTKPQSHRYTVRLLLICRLKVLARIISQRNCKFNIFENLYSFTADNLSNMSAFVSGHVPEPQCIWFQTTGTWKSWSHKTGNEKNWAVSCLHMAWVTLNFLSSLLYIPYEGSVLRLVSRMLIRQFLVENSTLFACWILEREFFALVRDREKKGKREYICRPNIEKVPDMWTQLWHSMLDLSIRS